MVRHPRLPFGRLWVPLLSAGVYLLAWVARVGVLVAPTRRLGLQGRAMPFDPKRVGAMVTKIAWTLLCSGSYTLIDLRVPEARLAVRVRVI